jgi:hypothetical protein
MQGGKHKGKIGLEISSPRAIAWLEKTGYLITYFLVCSPLLVRGIFRRNRAKDPKDGYMWDLGMVALGNSLMLRDGFLRKAGPNSRGNQEHQYYGNARLSSHRDVAIRVSVERTPSTLLIFEIILPAASMSNALIITTISKRPNTAVMLATPSRDLICSYTDLVLLGFVLIKTPATIVNSMS